MATGTIIDGTPTNGANPWIDSLVWGGAWRDADGGTVTITYAPVSGTDPYGLIGGGAAWESHELAALNSALGSWEAVANIDFVQTSSGSADIWHWVTDDANASGALGWHEVPAYAGEPLYGVFNYEGAGWTASGLLPGGYGYITLIHELGHGLGLAHPHDGGSAPDGTKFPGVTSAFGDYGDHNLNQGIFTTMSYNDGWASQFPSHSSFAYGWQATPMALDIAAVQAIYGANLSYRTGADTYNLPTVNGSGTFWSCIWDAGGTDLISAASANVSVTINLNAAPLTGPNAGGYVSSVAGIVGGVTIANGVVIENATGGAGGDMLVGNAAANLLTGNGGNDTLIGGAGNDTLAGGTGADLHDFNALSEGLDMVLGFTTGTGGDILDFSSLLTGYTGVLGDFVQLTTVGANTVVSVDADGGVDNFQSLVTLSGLTGLSAAALVASGNILMPGGGTSTGDDFAANTGTAGSVAVNGTATGSIETAGDLDWFRVSLSAGTTYSFHLEGGATGAGTLGDPLLSLHNGAGTLLASDDDGGAGLNSLLSFTPTSSGTYYLSAGAFGSATGTYTLKAMSAGGGTGQNIVGTSASEFLPGTSGGDTISGLGGDDTVSGGAGADLIDGGLGRDILTGGTGADLFDYDAIEESLRGKASRDQITDFSGSAGDRIDLSTIDANTGTAGDQAFAFIGGAAFSQTDGELRFANGVLAGDVNGDGFADFQIKLVGVGALSMGDLVL